jgi:glutamine cyclotransferase
LNQHDVLRRVARAVLSSALACCVGLAQAPIPVYAYVVKHSYPHDVRAFTQGLLFKDGVLYESTGLHGQSSIRKVQLESGRVFLKKTLPSEYFGEGITVVGNDIVSLTCKSQIGFVFDAKDLTQKRSFAYQGEGWGLASDGKRVFMSDGSATIRILDGKTLAELKRFDVTANGKPLDRLNELEWVDGQLFANIWGTDVIARIDPASGKVIGWIDLTGLLAPELRGAETDNVLNGIAYDRQHQRLFVTGKRWPKLFEIELVERTGAR